MAQIKSDMKGSKRIFSGDTEMSHLRGDDTTEASVASADITVPSLRSRAGDTNTLTRLRRPSEALSQGRRTSIAMSNRITSVARGKQRAAPSPRKPSTARPSHSTRPSEDITRELTADLTRMSLESSHVLAQFPAPPTPAAPPVRLVTASTSTAPGSPTKPSPGLLAPPTVPAYPSSSLRAGRNEDLTRFVSSSTASGTTLTAGSAESFVKHPGPKQMMHITPNDVPTLPERVGKMVFDRVMMRWVKATALATTGLDEAPSESEPEEEDGQDNESEDPFRDIESLREDDDDARSPHPQEDIDAFDEDEDSLMSLEKSRIEAVLETEVEDVEEAELTSFSTDGVSQEFVQDVLIEDGTDHVDFSYTDSDAPDDREEETGSTLPTATLDLPLQARHGVGIGIDDDDATIEPAFADTPPRFLTAARTTIATAPSSALATPNPLRPAVSTAPTPAPRSAMKSTSATPISALKDPSRSKVQTPANKLGHRRSVSFSDGKREGPIRGIGRNIPTPDVSAEGDDDSPLASGSRVADRNSAVLVPSARSKRIANMLDDLENIGGRTGASVAFPCPLTSRTLSRLRRRVSVQSQLILPCPLRESTHP